MLKALRERGDGDQEIEMAEMGLGGTEVQETETGGTEAPTTEIEEHGSEVGWHIEGLELEVGGHRRVRDRGIETKGRRNG